MNTSVWIVDFGSQYTQLITRRSREIGFSSEIITFNTLQKRWSEGIRPKALVLSGGHNQFLKIRVITLLFSTKKSFLFLGFVMECRSWGILWVEK